jgi:hypothetical protein
LLIQLFAFNCYILKLLSILKNKKMYVHIIVAII